MRLTIVLLFACFPLLAKEVLSNYDTTRKTFLYPEVESHIYEVAAEVSATNAAGVATFNGRAGQVTLFSNDVAAVYGAVVGPQGPQGVPGADGAIGPQGPAGANGTDAAVTRSNVLAVLPDALTNNAANVTLSGSFSGSGSGITNASSQFNFIGLLPSSSTADSILLTHSGVNPQVLISSSLPTNTALPAAQLTGTLSLTNLPSGVPTNAPAVLTTLVLPAGLTITYTTNGSAVTATLVNAGMVTNGAASLTIGTNSIADSGSSINGVGVTNKQLYLRTPVGGSVILSNANLQLSSSGSSSAAISGFNNDVGFFAWGTFMFSINNNGISFGNKKPVYFKAGAPSDTSDLAYLQRFDASTMMCGANFMVPGTITVTNGTIYPPKSSGPTWATVGTSNTFILWSSNSIPPTLYASYFDAASNRVDVVK